MSGVVRMLSSAQRECLPGNPIIPACMPLAGMIPFAQCTRTSSSPDLVSSMQHIPDAARQGNHYEVSTVLIISNLSGQVELG